MRTLIARYLTKTGKVGLEVYRTAHGYSYTGLWGAGSGGDYAEVWARVQNTLRYHKGWTCDTSVIA